MKTLRSRGTSGWLPSTLVLLVASTALGAGCTTRHVPDDQANEAQERSLKSAVASQPPEYRREEQQGFVAVVVASEVVEVATEFGGQLASIEVEIGSHVGKGRSLATLETTELNQELSMAEAELRASRALLEQRRVELGTVRQRSSRRHSAQELYSEEEREAVAGEALQAEAVLQAAAATVEQGETRVQQMKRRLASSTIRAPIEGKVALLYLDRGSRLSAGQKIMKMISTEENLVRFAVPPDVIGDLGIGRSIELRVDSGQLHLFGTVSQVAPNVDAPSQLVFCEAQILESPPWVRDGLVGKVFLR